MTGYLDIHVANYNIPYQVRHIFKSNALFLHDVSLNFLSIFDPDSKQLDHYPQVPVQVFGNMPVILQNDDLTPYTSNQEYYSPHQGPDSLALMPLFAIVSELVPPNIAQIFISTTC